jgi:ABC-2 type transport system permease protein
LLQLLALQDYIEIGIFMEETIKDKKVEKKELHLKKYKINKIDNKLSIIVNGKPTEVGLI